MASEMKLALSPENQFYYRQEWGHKSTPIGEPIRFYKIFQNWTIDK